MIVDKAKVVAAFAAVKAWAGRHPKLAVAIAAFVAGLVAGLIL